jgi:exodeoxyribonuclease VII large subunit
MSWDLFSSAEATRRAQPSRSSAGGGALDDEALAREVALRQLEGALPSPDDAARDWSVSEVNSVARGVVESVLPPLRVAGEVANFTRARSGHCYFSLRDSAAQLRCVMWREEARRLPTLPQEGMQVRALGRLTIYEARGEFQLVVSDLQAEGEGLWKLAFEQLHARLAAEGLTAPERKRPLPRCPLRVGVVTSPDGAALRDILSVIRRRAPWTEVVLAGCRVQGDGAAAEIAAAVERLGTLPGVEVLIVGRGGGSIEDLWAFNEEPVARAIAAAPVPVVSAVGHETDYTISDLVADLRAPTPSAAAEAVVPDGGVLRREVAGLRARIVDCTRERIAESRDALSDVERNVHRAAERLVRQRRDRLSAAAARLNSLSPLATLGRGYALPLDAQGRVLRSVAEFEADTNFSLRLADGEVGCRVVRGGADR